MEVYTRYRMQWLSRMAIRTIMDITIAMIMITAIITPIPMQVIR